MNIEIRKGLSHECSKLITDTYKLINSRTLFKNNRKSILENLNQLEKNLNIRLLNFLSYLVFDEDDEVSKQSNVIIYKIIRELSYKEIKLVDSLFRNSYYYYDMDFRIKNLDITRIRSKLSVLPHKEYLLCLLTLSGNGFIREFGVKELADIHVVQKMSFISLRLNDWVDQVRSAANESLYKSLKSEDGIEMLLETLPLFDHSTDWKKADFKKLELKLSTELYDLKNREKLVLKYHKTKDYRIKRSVFKVLVSVPELELEMIENGIRSKDPVIIKECLLKIREVRQHKSIKTIMPVLKNSKDTNCVILYCDIIEENDAATLKSELINTLIFHKSSKVREYARSKVSSMDKSINLLELYRIKMIDKGQLNFYAYQGFGEICTVDDFQLIKSFISHSEVRVKKTSLVTLYRLNFEESKDILLDYLCSDHELESRIARRIMSSSSPVSKIANELSELLFFEGFEQHVYSNILDLLDYAPKWLRINTMLKFTNIADGDLLCKVIKCIESWNSNFNKSFIKPTNYEKEEFAALFKNVENILDTKLRRELEVIVNY
jgi:hypothetical protein